MVNAIASSPRRAVITGIGVISPNGQGREAFWRATRQGTSGIRHIPAFEEAGLAVHIGGQVPDFNPLAHMDERDLPNVSRVVPLMLAASREALDDASLDATTLSLEQRRSIGVLVGSGGGALEFVERQFTTYFTGSDRRCSV